MRFIFDDNDFKHANLKGGEISSETALYILTRFNIPLIGARQKGGFEEEEKFRQWCRNRSRIFCDICLPSVVGQLVKPAAWIILFDKNYEEETRSALEAIAEFPWIKAVFIDENFEGLRPTYSKLIKGLLPPNKTRVATVRLDNDDALSRFYCAAVLQYIDGLENAADADESWISFPYGVQWDGQAATLLIQNNNPFLTFIEAATKFSTGNAKTAMSTNHGHIFEYGRVILPTARFPMWLQYVHDENVSNSKNGNLLRFADTENILKMFTMTSNTADLRLTT